MPDVVEKPTRFIGKSMYLNTINYFNSDFGKGLTVSIYITNTNSLSANFAGKHLYNPQQ